MQIHFQVLIAAAVLLFAGSAQPATSIWRDVTPAVPGARGAVLVRYFEADDAALRAVLAGSPHESSGRRDHELAIPLADGSLARFSVQESPVLAPALAAKYPEIRTFKVFGADDDSVAGHIDITPLGFHGMIQTRGGRVFIDPDSRPNVYRVRHAGSEPRRAFNCGVDHRVHSVAPLPAAGRRTAARLPDELQQYRLAVAVTNEYYVNTGLGSDISTTSAIGTTIFRVNFVYERDLGIRLQLIGNNDLLYESVDNGQLNNEDEFDLLDDVNAWIDGRVGDAAYDIGHMFSQPGVIGGGVAFIGAVCDSAFKGGGVSGLPSPTGDPFDIDLVAHEIGHQFNATHSFNGTTSSCATNRVTATAWEPGSGSSVMAYAGICAGENLQSNADAAFHSGSIEQIDLFTAGAGGACATAVPTPMPANNNDPTIDSIDDMTIPASTTIPANTPFLLDATASDVDLNTLEYRWDQFDAGCPTDVTSFGTDTGSNALFRSYEPRADSWRNFPALGTQIRGRYDRAEVLPCQNRALDFRLTVTDSNSGRAAEDVRVNIDNAAGPFEITNLDPDPGIVSGALTPFQVDWDVAGTDLAPINCASVDIELLAFNLTYARYSIYPLAAAVTNNGSAMVTLMPDTVSHPRARVRVKCSDNIFYDVSDTDLNITAGTGPGLPLDDTALLTRVFANPAITSTSAPACPAVVDCTPPPPPDSFARGSDSSSFGYFWLLIFGGLAAWRRLWPRQGLQ